MPTGDLVAEQGADGAVHVGHGQLGRHRRAALDGRQALLQEGVVEGPVETVVLLVDAEPDRPVGQLRLLEDGGEVEALGLPVVDGLGGVDQVDPTDGLLQRAEAERGQVLTDLLGDVLEEGLDELRRSRVAGPQRRVLGGDARPGRCRGGRPAS